MTQACCSRVNMWRFLYKYVLLLNCFNIFTRIWMMNETHPGCLRPDRPDAEGPFDRNNSIKLPASNMENSCWLSQRLQWRRSWLDTDAAIRKETTTADHLHRRILEAGVWWHWSGKSMMSISTSFRIKTEVRQDQRRRGHTGGHCWRCGSGGASGDKSCCGSDPPDYEIDSRKDI